MSEKSKMIISVCMKLLTVVFACWGLFKCLFSNGFMGGSTVILYFTMQSNIWLAVVGIILSVILLRRMKNGNFTLDNRLYILQLVFTVSITLTGFVFCFVLVPSFASAGYEVMKYVLAYEQIFLHVVTPLLAVTDLLVFTRHSNLKKSQCFWATLPPFYYLGFATVGYFMGWDFGGGNNFPYFFMNYGSPAGFFGFSNEMPYFMGSFYWIIALIVFVVMLTLLYIVIINGRIRKSNASLQK